MPPSLLGLLYGIQTFCLLLHFTVVLVIAGMPERVQSKRHWRHQLVLHSMLVAVWVAVGFGLLVSQGGR